MGELFVAGGVESMSRGPYVISKGTKPFDRSVELYDSTAGSRFPNPVLTKLYGDHTMPETADQIGWDSWHRPGGKRRLRTRLPAEIRRGQVTWLL